MAKLTAFTNPYRAISCTVTGDPIAVGETVYAQSLDHARNGLGLCEAAYKAQQEPPPPKVKPVKAKKVDNA